MNRFLKLCLITSFLTTFLLNGSVSKAQWIKSQPFPVKQGHLFSAGFAVTIPGADFKDRFGQNQGISADYRYKTASNFTFGLSYQWLFGNNVKELTMLDSMIGASGEVIDKDGLFSVVRISQRGHRAVLKAGKIIPLGVNKNSGLYFELGLGALIHKVDIQTPSATVPQLNGEYLKGYDRLTGGWAAHQFIGYQQLAPNRRTNFIVGFEFTQGRTRSLRNWDFDTRMQDNKNRLDLITSFKIGITLPVYTKKADEEEFFFD